MNYRKSFTTVADTRFGYPMPISNDVFGGVIVGFLGLKNGISANLVGALLLFAYVGPLSYRAGKNGINFPLMAKASFGTKGYTIVITFLLRRLELDGLLFRLV